MVEQAERLNSGNHGRNNSSPAVDQKKEKRIINTINLKEKRCKTSSTVDVKRTPSPLPAVNARLNRLKTTITSWFNLLSLLRNLCILKQDHAVCARRGIVSIKLMNESVVV